MKVPVLDHTVAQIDSALRTWIDTVTRVLNNISFASGVIGSENQNIDGIWLSGQTNAVINTETLYSHKLGRVPIGYLVFSLDQPASLYKSATAWSATQVSFKCNVASTNFLVFLI